MTIDGEVFKVQAESGDLLPLDSKRSFQKKFTEQAVRSFLFLSTGMGIVAVALPILLVAIGGYEGHYSISYFYHVGEVTRNILVGCLCAIGVFLVLFHGLSNTENWILNLAGLSAIAIANFPMSSDQCGGGWSVHGISALVFFASIAVVAVFYSKGRIPYIVAPVWKRRFTLAYNTAGTVMVAAPLTVALMHWLSKGVCESHWIFWIECLGIGAFAGYWFVKTMEYRMLLGIRK